MSAMTATASPARSSRAANWLIPAGLIALASIPIVAGAFRLTTLAGGAEITPGNLRFVTSPIPVVLHIASVTIYAILGAFQFSTGIRQRWPKWHRAAGRVLVVAGLVAALSGLWMAMFYAIVPADTALLHAFRLFFGSAMAVSIVLGFIAIRRRNVSRHQAWMRRAYAIGMGAGTQALIQIPYVMIVGNPDPGTVALLMGAAWLINLMVAEWLILRQRPHLPTKWAGMPGADQDRGTIALRSILRSSTSVIAPSSKTRIRKCSPPAMIFNSPPARGGRHYHPKGLVGDEWWSAS